MIGLQRVVKYRVIGLQRVVKYRVIGLQRVMINQSAMAYQLATSLKGVLQNILTCWQVPCSS